MSSETSTKDAFQPWQLFTLAGLVGATVVVFMSRGQTPAGIILLSLLVFAAAAIGSTALRAFLPLTQKVHDEGTQILGGRTRAALEREKALVLRSIKELEFDRAMRKVSDKDFAEMAGRLRARAARLMRQLDAGSIYRVEIEKEIERRLGELERSDRSTRSDRSNESNGSHESNGSNALLNCATCNTTNDPDARFCKGCGARLSGATA